MSLSPFTRGRLAISPPAIKAIAKSLAANDPMTSVMEGLRIHSGGSPFEINDEPIRDLTVIGAIGSGFSEISHALLHGASCNGFRVISVIYSFGMHSKGDTDVLWEEDPEQEGAAIRRGSRTKARVLQLAGDDGLKTSAPESVRTFLKRAISDRSTRQIFLFIPFLEKMHVKDALFIKKSVMEGLELIKDDLHDVVVLLENVTIKVEDHPFLETHAGGVLRTFLPQFVRPYVRDGSPCLFSKGSLPGAEGFEVGESVIGVYGKSDSVRGLQPVEGLYTNKAVHELHDTVLRALNVIHAEPSASHLSHTARLDLVSRACGFSGWHAAEASGKGVVEKVRGMLRRR